MPSYHRQCRENATARVHRARKELPHTQAISETEISCDSVRFVRVVSRERPVSCRNSVITKVAYEIFPIPGWHYPLAGDCAVSSSMARTFIISIRKTRLWIPRITSTNKAISSRATRLVVSVSLFRESCMRGNAKCKGEKTKKTDVIPRKISDDRQPTPAKIAPAEFRESIWIDSLLRNSFVRRPRASPS